MRGYCVTALLILLCTSAFASAPYNRIWQKANQFFERKQYDSAIHYYEKLAAHNLNNEEVYYNLGNAYYRANQIGPAVLNFERALQINPDYKAAKDNLTLTRSRIGNRIQHPEDIFFVRWWKSLTKQNLSFAWSVVSLIVFLAALVTLILRRLNKAPSWMRPGVTLATFILFGVFLFFAYISSQRAVKEDAAVVMRPDTPFRQDSKTSRTQSLVPEGTVVSVEQEQETWMQVTLPDGRTGWMQKDALEKI